MRQVVLLIVASAFGHAAMAADLDDGYYLRGSQYEPGVPTYYRWSGAYVGGQGGASVGRFQFPDVVASLIGSAFGQTPVGALNATSVPRVFDLEGNGSNVSASYGAFFGYNAQWADAVLGVELNYNHTSVRVAPTGAGTTTIVAGGVTYDNVHIAASSSATLTDYGTIRGRAGWVYGNLLPYGFVGVAIGHVDSAQTATVFSNGANPFAAVTQTTTQSSIGYGWTLGTGLDWAVLPHLFVRGEYEYIRFVNVPNLGQSGTSATIINGNLSLNSVRGAVAVKF